MYRASISIPLVGHRWAVCLLLSLGALGCANTRNNGMADGTRTQVGVRLGTAQEGATDFYDGPAGADHYKGQTRNGKMHGQGTHTLPDGAKYVGEWRNDKRHGQGTLTFPDGQKYVGEWRDGKQNGQGTYTWPDGRKYVGEFRDGKMHGFGTVTSPDGAKKEGFWLNGEFQGKQLKDE